MAGLDGVIELLTHPAIMPAWTRALNRGPSPDDALARLQTQLDRIETQTRRGGVRGEDVAATGAAAAVAFGAPPAPAPSLPAVRDQVVAVGGTLKEALRFAREDGMDHPEAQARLQDARTWLEQLPALERFDLAPERLAGLPPAERQTWEAALPHVRRLRQLALNELDTVEGLGEAAALAGTLGTALQTAIVATGATGEGWRAPPSAGVPTDARAAPAGPYSRYAPEMSVATGCVECGRGHLAAVAAVIGAAAADAEAKGPADPDVQARLAFAQEELAALFQYDWTDEKIAKNPAAERAVLAEFRPQVEALWQAARTAGTPEAVRAVAEQARTLRTAYEQALPSRGRAAYQSLATGRPAVGAESVRVRADRVYRLHQPDAAELGVVTAPVDLPTAFDRLVAALEACGTPVRVRALPATPDYLLEGEFDPRTGGIALAPAALAKDSYAVQTLVHEGLHSLLHGAACLPHPPADHGPQEQQAEDGTIATMVQAGLPLETREGTVVTPTGRAVDWQAVEQEWGPAATDNLRWASEWLAAALTGSGAPLPVCQTCPVPQEV